MHPHIKFGIPTSKNIGDMHRTRSGTDGPTDVVITIKTKSEVKVTVTRKWYATLFHPKMHPHTKFGIPTSKNIGDMHRTRSGTDGRTVRLLYASQSSFGGIKKTKTKAPSSLRGCAGRSSSLLFINPRRQGFSRRGPYMSRDK